MKCSALNVDFNGVRLDPLGSTSPPYGETIENRPGQHAYEMFGMKRRFQWCKDGPPRFKESSIRPHQIWVPPWKRAISSTVDQSSTRMVADRHRLAAHHNKHCWRAFGGYQNQWPWTPLNPKNMVLSDFFGYFRLQRTLQWIFAEIYWR